MTGEELDRAIEFLLKQQSQLSVDLETLKETQAETSRELKETSREVKETSREVKALASVVAQLSDIVADGFIRIETNAASERRDAREAINRLETQAELDRHEIRKAINNLIIANESTRDLSTNVARLAMQTSQRVTDLESKL
jgi:hypothetical protein